MFSKKESVAIVFAYASKYALRIRKLRDNFIPIIGDAKLSSLVSDALTSAEAIIKYMDSRSKD